MYNYENRFSIIHAKSEYFRYTLKKRRTKDIWYDRPLTTYFILGNIYVTLKNLNNWTTNNSPIVVLSDALFLNYLLKNFNSRFFKYSIIKDVLGTIDKLKWLFYISILYTVILRLVKCLRHVTCYQCSEADWMRAGCYPLLCLCW